jgi:hypothetical protein
VRRDGAEFSQSQGRIVFIHQGENAIEMLQHCRRNCIFFILPTQRACNGLSHAEAVANLHSNRVKPLAA